MDRSPQRPPEVPTQYRQEWLQASPEEPRAPRAPSRRRSYGGSGWRAPAVAHGVVALVFVALWSIGAGWLAAVIAVAFLWILLYVEVEARSHARRPPHLRPYVHPHEADCLGYLIVLAVSIPACLTLWFTLGWTWLLGPPVALGFPFLVIVEKTVRTLRAGTLAPVDGPEVVQAVGIVLLTAAIFYAGTGP